MKRSVVLPVIQILFTMQLFAQVPQGINYQAVVRDADGAALVGQDVSVRITLLSGGPEGSALFRETHHTETGSLGLISLVIGKGSGPDDLDEVDWARPGGIWLQTEVDIHDGGGYTLMGSQQLMSVPYALAAAGAAYAAPRLAILTQEAIDQLQPQEGTMVVNQSTGKLQVYYDQAWHAALLQRLESVFTCGGMLTDSRDGQSYQTVQIGNQCWMAENLNYGTQINASVNQSNNGEPEKYCYQNISSSCETYGGLYQWDELMNYTKTPGTQGICPEGWHIPSDQEVQEMEMALGMSQTDAGRSNAWRGSDEGLKLALGGSSGFDILYSGRSVTGGLFTAMGEYEYLWTSSESMDAAWRRCYRVNDGTIGRYDTFPKSYGMSVRCVKD